MAGDDVEYRLKALEDDSARNQATHKEFFARFEAIGKEHVRIDTQYGNIMTTLGTLSSSIEELKARPTKRWESVVSAIIAGVVSFGVAWVLRGGA